MKPSELVTPLLRTLNDIYATQNMRQDNVPQTALRVRHVLEQEGLSAALHSYLQESNNAVLRHPTVISDYLTTRAPRPIRQNSEKVLTTLKASTGIIQAAMVAVGYAHIIRASEKNIWGPVTNAWGSWW